MTTSIFENEGVVLRPFEPEDAPVLATYLNHPGLAGRRYVPWEFSDLGPLSTQQVQGILQKWGAEEKGLRLAVVSAESGSLIGHAQCDWDWDPHSPSLSVVIAPAHQRRDHGSAALRLLLRYLFGYTPAHNANCWISDWNQAGCQFAARHGFQENARMRRVGIREGRYYDLVVADLLRPEWQRRGGGPHAA
jgi:RimJ/RimL family protein N-acetyltransferase